MREKRNLLFRNLRGGVRDGYPDCRDIPCGAVAVRDGVSVDCLRLRLLSAAVRQWGSAWRTERERSGNYEYCRMESAEELTWNLAEAVRDEKAQGGITALRKARVTRRNAPITRASFVLESFTISEEQRIPFERAKNAASAFSDIPSAIRFRIKRNAILCRPCRMIAAEGAPPADADNSGSFLNFLQFFQKFFHFRRANALFVNVMQNSGLSHQIHNAESNYRAGERAGGREKGIEKLE